MSAEGERARYARLSRAVAAEPHPCLVVDVEAFERNVGRVVAIAERSGKLLRVATKSVRCPELIRRIVASAPRGRVGLMTYTAAETAFLSGEGFDDLLLAYPIAHASEASDVARVAAAGGRVAVVVDEPRHLALLDAAAQAAGVTIRVVIEVDVAYRPLGSLLHLGVRRSPLRGADDVIRLAADARAREGLRVVGIMAYEAQIAGLVDARPGALAEGLARRAMKARSRRDVERARASIVEALRRAGFELEIVNGGGTGNLPWCAEEAALTEVTAGSAFLVGHLFDGYRDIRPEPAAYFALRVARRPRDGIVTCSGGGYVASGAAGVDRLPRPALPPGLELLPLEGAGEVQTPLRLPPGLQLSVGDTVLFRHAKAGEVCERFTEAVLVREDRIEARAPTYRGLGHAFLG